MSIAEAPVKPKAQPLDLLTYLPMALAAGLMVAVYYFAMTWWYFEWTREGSFYAHGIFIPFFVGLMIWRDRAKIAATPIRRSWWGAVLIALALGLFLMAERANVTVPVSLSFVLFLIGAVLFAGGPALTKRLLFPLIFLLTMIPIVPDQLINPVAFPIQLTSAKMAASFCNLIHFDAVRVGTQIKMQHYTLDVELPCSGFKTLLGLLAFSAAFAYLVVAERWKKWTLFVSSMPLAVVVNGVRITLIALVGEAFGTRQAAAFHDYSGFIVLILGFLALYNLARVLKCDSFLGVPLTDEKPGGISPAAEENGGGHEPAPGEVVAADRRVADAGLRRASIREISRGMWVVSAMLACAVVARPMVYHHEQPIPALSEEQLPARMGDGTAAWTQYGPKIPKTAEIETALHPLTFINRRYHETAPGKGLMDLLITAGNGRRVFHDPHTCFVGSGYDLHDTGSEIVSTPVGPLKVQVAESEETTTHTKQLLMFVYVVDGKQYQTTQGVNFAIFCQMLFGESPRPSYFLRFTNLNPGTGPEQRDELRSFVRTVWAQVAPVAVGQENLKRLARR